MVAGLTADVFVQLTATLAQLAGTLNKTQPGLREPGTGPFDRLPNQDSSGHLPPSIGTSPSPPLQPLPVKTILQPVGNNVTLACPQVTEVAYVTNMEWLCYGCQGPRNFTASRGANSNLVKKVLGFGSDGGRMRLLPTPGSANRPQMRRRRGHRIRLSPKSYSLQFQPLHAVDEGDYFCLVNGRERPTVVTRLLVQDVPSAPGRPLVNAFSSRSVNLSWTPPLKTHHAPILSYSIHVREGEMGLWQRDVLRTRSNDTTYTVNDLKAYTTYSFKVTAINKRGPSKDSQPSYYTMTHRAVPSGRPTLTSAHNVSSTSLRLTWRPPPRDTINGEFVGYRIAFRTHPDPLSSQRRSEEDVREVLLKEPSATAYVLRGLKEFTKYLVSIQVVNPKGLGPAATVQVSTDEGVPSMPLNVRASDVTNSSVRLTWDRPAEPRGLIQGYRLYHMKDNNFTDVVTVRETGKRMNFVVHDLAPYTTYSFWLKAFTWKHEGKSSSPALSATTDVSPPSPPIITNVSCADQTTVAVAWDPPRKIYHGIDAYYVSYEREGKHFTQSDEAESSPDNRELAATIEVKPGAEAFKTRMVVFPNLTSHSWYSLRVWAATASLYTPDRLLQGLPSTPQRIRLRANCDLVQAFSVLETAREAKVSNEEADSSSEIAASSDQGIPMDVGTGVLSGIALVAMVLILTVVAFVLRRKFYHDSLYYVSDSTSSDAGAGGSLPLPTILLQTGEAPSSTSSTLVAATPTSDYSSTLKPFCKKVPLSNWLTHVARLRDSNGERFRIEFAALQDWEHRRRVAITTQEQGKDLSEGKSQENRFANVIAYEHSRVRLNNMKTGSLKKSSQGACHNHEDYIHANFLDGTDRPNAYIATQAPLATKTALSAFWRMIWEKEVKVIVMLVNLAEGGRPKCDQYWPVNSGSMEQYGPIQVTHLREDNLATYTIRAFKLKHSKGSKKAGSSDHYVLQYHFTAWPEQGVPTNPVPLLSFIRKSSDCNRDHTGPIVVHCSAGVGRTGVYILVDAMLKQMKSKGELSTVAYLRHIRTQRNFMVQTEEQYIFCHELLAEAVASGETSINRSYLSRYINSLQNSFTTDENAVPWQLVDRQFKLITGFSAHEAQYADALKPCNHGKNQNFDFLPPESSRLSLLSKAGLEGSDYINATWMPGFQYLKEYIITQHPVEHTVQDFWQLLWEQNVHTVVVLSTIQQTTFGIFWPGGSLPLEFTTFRVKLVEEGEIAGFQCRDFQLESIRDDLRLPVVDSQVRHRQGGPLVVLDRFGGTEAATFCAFSTLLKQLDFENHVDVYAYCKAAHRRKPGIWKSQADLIRIYKVLEEFVQMTSYRDSVEDLEKAGEKTISY